MIFDKLREWATAGSVESPTTTKIDDGFVFREKVPMEWLNWLHSEKDKRVNGLLDAIQTALGSTPPADTTVNVGRRNPLGPLADWNQPWTDQNAVEIDASNNISDVAVGWDSTLEIPVAFFAHTSSIVAGTIVGLRRLRCWQYGVDQSTMLNTFNLTPGFDIEADSNNRIPMVCADGFLYIVVTRAAASGGGKFLQQYPITTATGTPTASTEWITSANDAGDYSNLCEADDDTLAMVQQDSAGGFFHTVHFADKNTTPGTPSTPVGTAIINLRRPLASDGTNLYWSDDAGSGPILYRMPIATKTETSFLAALSGVEPHVCEDILPLGGGMVVALFRRHTATTEHIKMLIGYDNAGTFTKGGEAKQTNGTLSQDCGCIGFDGINTYLTYSTTYFSNVHHYVPVSSDRYMVNASYKLTDVASDSLGAVYTYDAMTFVEGTGETSMSSFYDGRDVWIVHHFDPRTAYRITSPGTRKSV